MRNAKMELLRNEINTLMALEDSDANEILNKSRELDKLILLAIKTQEYGRTVLGDEFITEFSSMIDRIQLFDRMYDFMRIVDPISKKVLEIIEKDAEETDLTCYDFWNRNNVCENCISIRAYNENNIAFKIECNSKNVCMITAIPVNINEKRIVVEMIKEADENLFFIPEDQKEDSCVLNPFEHMNQMMVKDELTKVHNKRFINERLSVDLFNASATNTPLSFLFLDIDYFKDVNDRYGHTIGDQVLKNFAAVLALHIFNNKDWLARYGGDEFLICLQNTDLKKAKEIAEQIRTSVMQEKIATDKGNISVTCCIGVYTVDCGYESLTVDRIIDFVDKRLYTAKAKGRNRVV